MIDFNLHEIIDRHHSELTNYCLRLAHGNGYEAEEIVSDVFLLLVEKQDELYFDEIRAWLYRTADNRAHKRRSRAFKTANKTAEPESYPEIYEEDTYSSLVSEEDIEKYASDIVESLSDEERRLYEYRYIQKKTLMDISKITSIPYSTLYDKYTSLEKKIRSMVSDITDNFIS